MSSEEAPDLPADYRSRPLSLDDIDAISRVWRRCDASLGVHPESRASFLHYVLRLPYVVRDRDTRAVEVGDQLVAFVVLQRDPASAGSALSWFADVDPSHQGRGIGSSILPWALGVAMRRMRNEGAFDVQTMASAPNAQARRLFESAGFQHLRSMWDMHRDVRGYDEAAALPGDVAIRTSRAGRDERTFWRVTEDAFAEHLNHTPTPFESWEASWLAAGDMRPDRMLLAERDGAVVGETAWVDSEPDGYIVSVGVLPEHRGHGIAQALLRRAFADIAAAGSPNATLTVDTENTTDAVELYRKVGMEPIRETHTFQRERA